MPSTNRIIHVTKEWGTCTYMYLIGNALFCWRTLHYIKLDGAWLLCGTIQHFTGAHSQPSRPHSNKKVNRGSGSHVVAAHSCSANLLLACSVVDWVETPLLKSWQAVILTDEFVWIRFASLGIKIWSLFRESAGLKGFRDGKSKRKMKHLLRTYFVIFAGLQRHSKQCIQWIFQDSVNVWIETF